MSTTAADTTMPAPAAKRGQWRARITRILLATGSGAVLFLSFAPRPLWWLAPLAFAGFGLALRGRQFWGGFGLGQLFGLAFFLPLLIWLQEFLGADFGPWPWLALCAVLALYLALAGGLITWVSGLPCAPVWMALIVISLETPRTWFPLGGFPWGKVAFSQPEGAFLSLASVGGTPLVGFAVVLAGFGLAALCRVVVAGRPWRPLVPALAMVLPLGAGLAVWPTIGVEAQDGSRTVAAVQGSAPDTGIGMLTQASGMRASHLAESERLLAQIRARTVPHPDLVVWPETATAIRGPDPRIDQLVDEFGAPTLIGAAHERADGSLENAVIAWAPGRGPGPRYVKQQLVPFGEYVPMRAIARLVTPFVSAVDERVPGSGESAALPVAGTQVGAMICYEAAYDYVSRHAVDAGAELLTAPTNNAWYGRSEMSAQHLAMSQVRAVEHSRAVVVSATTGISAIVAPDGSISKRTALFTPDSLVERVPLRQQTTLADRLDAWSEYGLVALALAGLSATALLRIRARRGNSDEAPTATE